MDQTTFDGMIDALSIGVAKFFVKIIEGHTSQITDKNLHKNIL